jgi:gamma-glutamylcyclotransferase
MFATKLQRHTLRFHKRSTDGSGKADAEYTGNDSDLVWGFVYELDQAEKWRLDQAEGLGNGYWEKEITVVDCRSQTDSAVMYYADKSHKDSTLKPYSWYLRFVLEGAKQHRLPADYVESLEAVESIEDRSRLRDARERRIICV